MNYAGNGKDLGQGNFPVEKLLISLLLQSVKGPKFPYQVCKISYTYLLRSLLPAKMAGTVADDLVPFSIPVLFKLILLLTLGALLYKK